MARQAQKKRVGRPRVSAADRKRNNLTLRIRDALREKLGNAAEANQRSISEEAERRLEQSFESQNDLTSALRVAYGDKVAGLVLLCGQAFNDAGNAASDPTTPHIGRRNWLDDPYSYDQAVKAVGSLLWRARPEGVPAPPKVRQRGIDAKAADAINAMYEKMGSLIADEMVQAVNGRRTYWDYSWLDTIGALLGRPLAERMEKSGKPKE